MTYIRISSSDPPGLGKKEPKDFNSEISIVSPVSSYSSFAATPAKCPLSSIIPAGASNSHLPAGTLNYLVRSICLLFTITRTATDFPRTNTNPFDNNKINSKLKMNAIDYLASV